MERDGHQDIRPEQAAAMAGKRRAVERTRAAHAGESCAEVRRALIAALREEGVEWIVPQALDEVAERISAERRPTR
ncbi:hypothetical protein [Nocardiopsis potens]|uniref:hypothetical protein n=1 Tax=Nocardiopsis potens TaxID=1246458 RepID=UPI00034C7619|nr:hypothetical protein [Nocardiopsis potens]